MNHVCRRVGGGRIIDQQTILMRMRVVMKRVENGERKDRESKAQATE